MATVAVLSKGPLGLLLRVRPDRSRKIAFPPGSPATAAILEEE